MNTQPIIVEKTVNASISRVWKALTDREDMKQWYFDIPDFRPEPGARFTFIGNDGEREFVHYSVIKEVIPNRKLSYSWSYEGTEDSLVSFELSEEGKDKTRVRLTHAGVEKFPAGDPSFRRENFEKGWGEIINKNLPGFVGFVENQTVTS